MDTHSIFYYPYGSFQDVQAPLLKVAALYFDKLYILDPLKAASGSISIADTKNDIALLFEQESILKDIALLVQEGILERIAPEDVLDKYEEEIEAAIYRDLVDEDFLDLCGTSGRHWWNLALAKVPAAIRNDPKYQRLDQAMQRLMGWEQDPQLEERVLKYLRDLPIRMKYDFLSQRGRPMGSRGYGYMEAYNERNSTGKIEYRYSSYGATILLFDARRMLSTLGKAGLVDGHDRLGGAQVFQREAAHLVTHSVGIPDGLGKQALHAIGGRFACMLGYLPAIFAFHATQDRLHKAQHALICLWSGKVGGQTSMHLQQGATPTHHVRKGRQQRRRDGMLRWLHAVALSCETLVTTSQVQSVTCQSRVLEAWFFSGTNDFCSVKSATVVLRSALLRSAPLRLA
jgi:hypothetical protein